MIGVLYVVVMVCRLLTFSRYLAMTMEASHTVVPRCSELGFWDSRSRDLQWRSSLI